MDRYAYAPTANMDKMSYSYAANSNKLTKVTDAVAANTYTTFELKSGQANNNYVYDKMGRLLDDVINTNYYTYDAYGMVTAVHSNSARTTLKASFEYDEMGNRILKKTPTTETRYVFDAAGSLMAVYDRDATIAGSLPALKEWPVYGMSRIGLARPVNATSKTTYELMDHLGNVRTTYKEGKITSITNKYGASATEYLFGYAKGIDLAKTSTADGSGSLKFGTGTPSGSNKNIFENFDVVPGDVITFSLSSFINSGGTSPQVYINFELYNNQGGQITGENGTTSFITYTANTWKLNSGANYSYTVNSALPVGTYKLKAYFIYSGNTYIWIDDVTASFQAGATSGWYVPLQQSLADYYPHGSILPGRNFISADGPYRFGYQGQFAEADAETNFNNFELRQYDPVTGRWMTTDPFGQYHSPYLAMGNDPVNSIDPTGGAVDPWGCFFISAANAATAAAVVGAGASSLSNGLTGGIDPPKIGPGPPPVPNSEGGINNGSNSFRPDPKIGAQVMAPLEEGFFTWDGLGELVFGQRQSGPFKVGRDGKISGYTPNMGMPPDFIGGPLRKGQSALKLGKYLFNPTAFHGVKKGVLALTNPKNFAHLVGTNPDLMFKSGKVFLTGARNSGFYGKSYETGMTIVDFLKLF